MTLEGGGGGGGADNCVLQLEHCKFNVDSDCKFSQSWSGYQKQLCLLFGKDSNFVHNMNNVYHMNYYNTCQVMHVCDPLLGNHWYGISGDDPDHGRPLDGNLTFHGSQNDRKRSMNLQDHEHYNYDYVDCNSHCWKPQSMRQPHNCISKVENNTVHKPFDLGDCSTRLCTVQFMNRYWLGTDIKTHLVFLSDSNTVKKFHFWNHILSSNEIIITECSGEALGFLQTVQVLVNFCGDKESDPRLVHEEYVKDLHSRNRSFKSYPDYILHIIDKTIDQIDKNSVKETVNCQTVMCSAECTIVHHHNTPCNAWNQVDTLPDIVVRDFHDPGKTRGFMAHKSMEFQFIGPDRPPPTSTTLSDYINMATIIEATGYLITSWLDFLFIQA